MKITIAQLNPIVGDIKGNVQRILPVARQACQEGSDIIVFPEMYLCGYPPRDLLKRKWFINQIESGLKKVITLSKQFPEQGFLIGGASARKERGGNRLYNTAFFIYQGKILFQKNKSLLPTYDVFDEARYFEPDDRNDIINFKGKKIGISICEDAWNVPGIPSKVYYRFDPVREQALKGAELFLNISASPFHMDKEKLRYRTIHYHARRHHVPFILVNQVGANDELIFDGRSMAVDAEGRLSALCPLFRECVTTIDTDQRGKMLAYKPHDKVASVHDALVLGLRDYVRKCGFHKVVLGLSGGIDSALVAYLAVTALGADNVLGISMPSPYSSTGSMDDSKKLAKNLGIDLKVISITDVFWSYKNTLQKEFQGLPEDIAEENIQPRIRGNILMALSNKFGYLVLSTGNKSELSVGYCTLYGDMSGGLSVISDVPKTLVYKLSRYANRKKELIPKAIIRKAPSAELKPDQKDQDTLPSYGLLDEIVDLYIEKNKGLGDIVKKVGDKDLVKKVLRMIDMNEYKRRQAPPGIKIMPRAFGKDRRMPITNKFNEARYEGDNE